MKSRDYSKYGSNISFIDMLFALLLGVFAIFILTCIMIGTPKPMKNDSPNDKSQVMITMTWDDQSANDIDMWVLTPEHNLIGYANKENPYMALERDDTGLGSDTAIVNGQKVILRVNKEIIRMRQRRPGHYVVNGFYFAAHIDGEKNTLWTGALDIRFEIAEVNPVYNILFVRTITLPAPGAQGTAFEFDILPDGTVTNFEIGHNVPFIKGIDGSEESDTRMYPRPRQD